MIRLYLVLFFLFASLSSYSTQIHGTVLDEKTKEPLIGAIVVIKGTNIGAPVSLSGNFKLIVKTPGTYTLVCSFVSYETLEKTIVISNEEKVNVDFELKQNAAELNEIVVTGAVDK